MLNPKSCEPSLEAIIALVILIKVAISPVSYASSLLIAPVAFLYVAKSIIYASHAKSEKRMEELSHEVDQISDSIKKLHEDQEHVFKQAEETKSLLSKFNIASAFTKKG